jgi:hypothetical protein
MGAFEKPGDNRCSATGTVEKPSQKAKPCEGHVGGSMLHQYLSCDDFVGAHALCHKAEYSDRGDKEDQICRCDSQHVLSMPK